MEVQTGQVEEVSRRVAVDVDMTQEYEKQQLSQVYKEIKQELTRFKPESLATFEEWVTRIYKFKVKVTDLGLQTKNIQFSISSTEIQKIINRVLIEACEIHKQLIEQQVRLIRDQGEEYYKIDDQPEIGYFNGIGEVIASEGKPETNASVSSCPNEQFYSYCVWVIYNHYCSLSECNEIVCELAKIFHETSENLVYRIFKQIDKKKISNHDEIDKITRTINNCHQIRHIVSMVEDEEVIQINQLNIHTIVNLIPPTMALLPHLLIHNHTTYTNNSSTSSNNNRTGPNNSTDSHNNNSCLDHSANTSWMNKEQKKEENVLYWHICSFETTINSIIYENKQNMRRYVVFLRNFKKAIKILKDRLGKSGNLYLQNMQSDLKNPNTSSTHTNANRSRKERKQGSRNKFSFSEQCLLSNEIQKNIDLFRSLDDQFIVDNEQTKSDEAELVRNLESSLAKQKIPTKTHTSTNSHTHTNSHTNSHTQQQEVQQQTDEKQERAKREAGLQKLQKQLEMKQTFRKISSLRNRQGYYVKNETLMQSTDNNFESITRISAMKSQKMNIQRYKLQVILKKNDKNEKSDRNQRYEKNEKNEKDRKYRKDGQNSFIEEFNQKRKKMDIQLSEHLQKEIVSELKNNLNNLMKNPLTKQEQFANYLKITEKHSRKKIFGFDDHIIDYQPNLHQFIQRANFRNDQESEPDQNYLEKMEEENIEMQKKKKKKKNKKKKNQKEQKNQTGLHEDNSKTNSEAVLEVSSTRNSTVAGNNLGNNTGNSTGNNTGNNLGSNLGNNTGSPCRKQLCKGQINLRQYQIIKSLQSTKIEQKRRQKCYWISDLEIENMYKTQQSNLCLEKVGSLRTETSVVKQSHSKGQKNKRNKIK